jgi:hypothetical protein
MGMSEATFCRRKMLFAGMGAAEIWRLKKLEDENAKPKKLVFDLSLDKTILQDALRRMWEGAPHGASSWRCADVADGRWRGPLSRKPRPAVA